MASEGQGQNRCSWRTQAERHLQLGHGAGHLCIMYAV